MRTYSRKPHQADIHPAFIWCSTVSGLKEFSIAQSNISMTAKLKSNWWQMESRFLLYKIQTSEIQRLSKMLWRFNDWNHDTIYIGNFCFILKTKNGGQVYPLCILKICQRVELRWFFISFTAYSTLMGRREPHEDDCIMEQVLPRT